MRVSFIAACKQKIEQWLSAIIPSYDTYKRMAEENLKREITPLPYTSALIKVDDYWQPAYIIEQDSRDNYVVFFPDTRQTTQGRVLFATKIS